MSKKYNGERGYSEYLRLNGQKVRTFEDIENEDRQIQRAESSKKYGVNVDGELVPNNEFLLRILSLVEIQGNEIVLQTPNIDIRLKLDRRSKFVIFDIDGQTKLIARSMCDYEYHAEIIEGIAEKEYGLLPGRTIKGGYIKLTNDMIDFYSYSEGYGRFDKDNLLEFLEKEVVKNTDANRQSPKEQDDLEPWDEEEQDLSYLYDEQLKSENSRSRTLWNLRKENKEIAKGNINYELFETLQIKHKNRKGTSKGKKHRERGKTFVVGSLSAEDRLKLFTHILDDFGLKIAYKKTTLKGYENHFVLCPFHQENTPSFAYVPEKGFFYCFGCQEGGTLVDLVIRLFANRKVESLTEEELRNDYGAMISKEILVHSVEQNMDKKEVYEYIIGWKRKLGIKSKKSSKN